MRSLFKIETIQGHSMAFAEVKRRFDNKSSFNNF